MADKDTPAADLIAEYHSTTSANVQSFKEMLAALAEEMVPPMNPSVAQSHENPTKMRKQAQELVILENKRVEKVRVLRQPNPSLFNEGYNLLLTLMAKHSRTKSSTICSKK